MNKEFLCRVEEHFCIECCKGRTCFLLGPLEDGTIGCKGHDKPTADGLSISPYCLEFNCLDGKTQEEINKLCQQILNLPKEEFKISDIIKNAIF